MNLPGPRDEHSTIQLAESMVVFGGFSAGKRKNDMYQYFFKSNVWRRLIYSGQCCATPCPRSGHSASYKQSEDLKDYMYIFGGKDSNNKKLNDFWKFDFELLKWTELSIKGGPSHRSGHTSSVYGDFLMIYGGIYDVTKELNDLHIYSFK